MLIIEAYTVNWRTRNCLVDVVVEEAFSIARETARDVVVAVHSWLIGFAQEHVFIRDYQKRKAAAEAVTRNAVWQGATLMLDGTHCPVRREARTGFSESHFYSYKLQTMALSTQVCGCSAGCYW